MDMRNNNKLRQPSRTKRRGVLALEWVLLMTVVVVGVIGGLAAVRNATAKKLMDLNNAVDQINVKTQAEIVAEGGS